MPRISHEKKQFYKAKIRSLLAIDHSVSNQELALRLEQEGIKLERHYIAQLTKEVYSERINRADRKTLNQALAVFEDTMTEIVRIAWEIAQDPFARKFDRVQALKEIREAHNDVFEKLFDAGVFDRKQGTLEIAIRNTPLPDERKKAIRDVFENWGLLPAPKEDAGTKPSGDA